MILIYLKIYLLLGITCLSVITGKLINRIMGVWQKLFGNCRLFSCFPMFCCYRKNEIEIYLDGYFVNPWISFDYTLGNKLTAIQVAINLTTSTQVSANYTNPHPKLPQQHHHERPREEKTQDAEADGQRAGQHSVHLGIPYQRYHHPEGCHLLTSKKWRP